MSSRVRRYLGAAMLLLAAPLYVPAAPALAAPIEACAPAPKAATSLCATYDVQVLAAGTQSPTTSSQAPFDLRVSWQNTSTNYQADVARARWLKRVSTTLVSQGDRQPMLAKSADLPQGLLVAGSATNCVPGADFSFSACSAGHGTAWVKLQKLGPKELKATFGIQRIYHNKTLATGHHAVLQADISYCIDTNGGTPSCERAETLSHAVAIDKPAADQSWQLPFELPLPSDWGLAGAFDVLAIGIDSVVVNYRGISDQLTTGPASGQFTLMKLPMRCGFASVSGTAISETAGTINVPSTLNISECSQITDVQSPVKLVSGQEGVISGVVEDFDTGAPMVGEEIQLRTCNISFQVPCGFTTGAQLTLAGGAFSFTVSPTLNTHFFVRVPPIDGKPEQWILRRIDVAPKITLAASRTRMPSGANITLSGLIKPGHDGQHIQLQRKVSGVWTTFADPVLTTDSTYSLTTTLTGAAGEKAKLRAYFPGHTDHVEGASPKVIVEFR